MKKFFIIIAIFTTSIAHSQRSDIELARDSVLGWKYLTPPFKAQTYKPVKDRYSDDTYTVWQQQIGDTLAQWVMKSYLPRGLVMRGLGKNYSGQIIAAGTHSYGIGLGAFSARFVDGAINLHCCEIAWGTLSMYFNGFPGNYASGFNPEGLYFFIEKERFNNENFNESDATLKGEGIDKRIQPDLYPYRTYVHHYHNDGKQITELQIVIPKNGEWPFKPVLVKDAVKYIDEQLAKYPGILKDQYVAADVKDAEERLKPYYNQQAISGGLSLLDDDNGHAIINPRSIMNGEEEHLLDKYTLVSATQQVIDQSKTDKPLWLYITLPEITGCLSDSTMKNGNQYLTYSFLRNFNFDYVYNWLSNPDKVRGIAYTPLHEPKKSFNNIAAPANVSATTAAKRKDPYTILYEDFEGYPTGTFSATGWHTYGHDGNEYKNATLKTIDGKPGKWISIPGAFTFFPDFPKLLPSSFTVNYDVIFGKDISNKRSSFVFRLETYEDDLKKHNEIDLSDVNRDGFEFAIAQSGEIEYGKNFQEISYVKPNERGGIPELKNDEVTHITVSVKGAAVAVSVNGKQVMQDNSVLSAGYTFKRYGWYSGDASIGLSNIYIKSDTPISK